MTNSDTSRAIIAVKPNGPSVLDVRWSNGTCVRIDLSGALTDPGFAPLRDPSEFAKVRVGEWGHSVEWEAGPGLSADNLWLETLTATGHDDTRTFLEWRLRHGLSLNKAADALGLSRRMVAYYSNGEKRVPKSILLACRGWEVSEAA